MTSAERAMSVTNIRVRTTSASAEAGLGQGPLDDLEDGPRLRRDVARMARPAVRAGVGRAGDPARIADGERPAVAGAGLPRPARRDPPPLAHGRPALARRRPATRARRGPRGRAAIASSSPASSVVRGTIESTSRYSAGAWSLPPIGPSPSRLGMPMPGGRVRVGRAAGRRRRRPRTRGRSRRPGRGRPGGRCARASPSATSAPSRSNSTRRVGDLGRLGDAADLGLGGLERLARRSRGRRPRASSAPATTFGRVPPAMTPTLTVTPGQRPLSAWRRARSGRPRGSRCGPSPARRPACAARPWTVSRRSTIPLRADTMSPLARAHSSTRATSMPAALLDDVRRRGRRADLLVGVGHEHEPLERHAAALGDDRLERVQAGQQARLHVGHARAVGDAVVDPERPLGRGARVEDRVHVADRAGPAAPPGRPWNVATIVSPRRPAGSGRRSTSAPSSARNDGHPAPDLVDAGLGVAAAVDVDQALEVGEECRQVGADRAAQARRARRWTGRPAARTRRSSGQSSRWHLAILPGPCVWSRSACSRAPTSTGSSRWSSSRSRSAGGGPGTASAIPAATRWSSSAPTCRPATGPIPSPRPWPGSAASGPTTARAAAGSRSTARPTRGTGS